MGRCFGITRNLHRCNRRGEWKLFCIEHRRQPYVWLFILVFTILSGLASMQSAWWPSHVPDSVITDGRNNDSQTEVSTRKSTLPVKHAQVLFTNIKLILPTIEGDPVRIAFGLINTGDADANVILKDRTYYFSTNPEQTVFKFQPAPAQEIMVSAIPNAIWRAEMRFNFRLTPEKLDALKSGKARLFFYAHGEYRDATGKIYPLPFAEMYDPMFPGNLISPPKGIFFE